MLETGKTTTKAADQPDTRPANQSAEQPNA
jgi:hypothetical protein